MNETLEYIQTFARFPFALRRFLQHRLTLDEAKQIVRERTEHREETFLRLVEKSVYGYPRSPYLPLLKMAGCELRDLCALVRQKGLEGALRGLRTAGVYVTFEEFKGRKPIVRNGTTIPVTARDFDNPLVSVDFSGESGGSTGAPMKKTNNLDFTAALAPNQMVTLAAHGVLDAPIALWRGILPDNSAISYILRLELMNRPAARWFSHLDWRDSKKGGQYALATYWMVLSAHLWGARIPFPEFVPMERADVIVQWMNGMLRKHKRCVVGTQVSRAMRICLAAEQAGLNLTGALFIIAGEPATEAKLQVIERTGARHFTTYGAELGRAGMGCARPFDGTDVHLMQDAFALITHPETVPGFDVQVPAFNLTTLLPSSSRLMLNVAVDDYGIVEERHCGCELESLGWTTHLRDIHSYRKLTGEGVTMVGSEMLHILETVLPARFGGGPLDYQLLEEEDNTGFTRLSLIVSPRIELSNEQAVLDVMLDSLRESSSQADAARGVWAKSNTFRIKRMEPIWTARGKLMPLHTQPLARAQQKENPS